MSKYYRLIYTSQAGPDMGESDFRTIAMLAAIKNLDLGVTGLLLTCQTDILQILEGQKAAVESLYETISADSRHLNVKIISAQSVQTPEYQNWSMGYRPLKKASDMDMFFALSDISLHTLIANQADIDGYIDQNRL